MAKTEWGCIEWMRTAGGKYPSPTKTMTATA
jgi:hypothetical protein